MTENEKERYNRQIMMEEVGEKGQMALKKSTVAIVGLGGLGSPAALYLAAAGVGKLILIDSDLVELSNLNRQILHGEKDIGRSKVSSAVDRVKELNSDVSVVGINKRLTRENGEEILKDADVIIDALDSFESRYVLNEVAVKIKKPLVHGACMGFEGRLSVIVPFETACFSCIYPEKLTPQKWPVIGVTPAIIGNMQALEVIKFITGIGFSLKGKLLIFDGAKVRFETINVKRDLKCKVCGGSR